MTVLADWQLLIELNKLSMLRWPIPSSLRPRDEPVDVATAAKHASTAVLEHLPTLGAAFQFPQVEMIAVLWPGVSAGSEL